MKKNVNYNNNGYVIIIVWSSRKIV